jgi:hypothetical protein
MPMDPLLRGVCEQFIDTKLKDGEIKKIKDFIEALDLPIEAKGGASLGMFYGLVFSQIDDHYLKIYNRWPNKEELEDYHEILQRRAPEIRSKFSRVIQKKKTVKNNGTKKKKKKAVTKKGKTKETKPSGDEKFSFDTNSKKPPITNILGIPTRGQTPSLPT